MSVQPTSSSVATAAAAEDKIFKFVPFTSFVQASFWHKLTELKLDIDRLSETSRPIRGFYSNANNPGQQKAVHEVDCTGFNSTADSTKPGILCSVGVLHNKNTIESFKAVDKVTLCAAECLKLWDRIVRGEALTDPSLLVPFVLLSFADLKKHRFYYWFAFPTIARQVATIDNIQAASEYFKQAELTHIASAYFGEKSAEHRSFFILQTGPDGGFVHRRLNTLIDAQHTDANFAADGSTDGLYFCFSDPSVVAANAGWPARMFVAMLLTLCPRLRGQTIRLLAVRCDNAFSVRPSVLFRIRLMTESLLEADQSLQVIGWERNEQGKMLPRMANMAASMDPERLANTSVSLNLKLMKWRLMPTLDLDRIAGTKCLLMGAGTLGCAVARNLIAWGVKHITFVDNGKVSHSNPVRQSLFVFEDAIRGSDKAPTAAKRLADICPGLQTAGHSMHIPMPGHPVGTSSAEQQKTSADLKKLETLVMEHDAVFLLTDSRESRWLPTMLGAVHDKIVMNAALGFDSYLVMRHGSRRRAVEGEEGGATTPIELAGLKCIDGSMLGCYFCNDITAPGNSLKDRTLDQQCTVTRPGVSNIAGALVVELLVSLLQHKRAALAPAYISCRQDANTSTTEAATVPEGLLGIIPHSLRGQLHNFEQILPATERYRQCIACSERVLHEYRTHGEAFLSEVFNSAKHLEDLTGISEAFHCRADDELLELLSDSDDFE